MNLNERYSHFAHHAKISVCANSRVGHEVCDGSQIHTAIAQLDQDLMTLEAAHAGFSQKQADVQKAKKALPVGLCSIGMLSRRSR